MEHGGSAGVLPAGFCECLRLTLFAYSFNGGNMFKKSLEEKEIHVFVDVDSSRDQSSTDYLRLWVCVVSVNMVVEDPSGNRSVERLHFGEVVGYGGGGVQETLSFQFNSGLQIGMVKLGLFDHDGGFGHWFDDEETGELNEELDEFCPSVYDPEDWETWFSEEIPAASRFEDWLEEDETGGHLVLKRDATSKLEAFEGPILRYAENEADLLSVIDSVASLWGWPMHLKYANGKFKHMMEGL